MSYSNSTASPAIHPLVDAVSSAPAPAPVPTPATLKANTNVKTDADTNINGNVDADFGDNANNDSNAAPKSLFTWRIWAVIATLCITSLLSALDISVIPTAMPSIVEDLGSTTGYAWIGNAYLLTMTSFQPLYGQTANIFGRRSLIIIAVVLFAVGSAVSGAAPNLGALVAGRAIQGIGGGGINILIDMIIADLLPLRERPRVISLVFLIYTIALMIGPVIGGLMSERVTWRWIFYLNLPVAGVALILIIPLLRLRYVKDTTRNSLLRVDWLGNALLIASVVAVLLSLTWGGVDYPWSSWRTITPLVLGLVGILAFLAYEFSPSQFIKEPTMPKRIFSNRTSAGTLALTFLHALLLYSMLYFLPVYFQGVLHTGAVLSGVYVLPMLGLSVPFGIVAAVCLTKFGHFTPWFFLGNALFIIAFGCFTLLDEHSSKGYWVGVQCIGAAAVGFLLTTTLPAIQAPLSESDQAVTTATWGFVRSFGGVWGVAIPAAAFNSRVDSLAEQLGDAKVKRMLSHGGAYALASLGNSDTNGWSDEMKSAVTRIYVESLKRCWYVCLAFSGLAFLVTFTVKEFKLRTELDTDFGLENKADAEKKQQQAQP